MNTPVGGVPCSDHVVTPVPDSVMTLLPFVALRPAPPNVSACTGKADSAVSCHVAAFAGSAAAPTARALTSSGHAMIPTALLRLNCMDSYPSASTLCGRCQTIWHRGPPTGNQITVPRPMDPLARWYISHAPPAFY